MAKKMDRKRLEEIIKEEIASLRIREAPNEATARDVKIKLSAALLEWLIEKIQVNGRQFERAAREEWGFNRVRIESGSAGPNNHKAKVIFDVDGETIEAVIQVHTRSISSQRKQRGHVRGDLTGPDVNERGKKK